MTQEHDAKALLEGTTPGPWELRGPTLVYGNLQRDQNWTGDKIASTVSAEDARLIAAAPDLARQVITLTTRAETAEAEVDRLREGKAARERDWWNPDPEDHFWMLEAEDGEWLKNKHSLLGTRDAVKAMRFPTEAAANSCRRGLPGGYKWWSAKPTKHLWIALLKETEE